MSLAQDFDCAVENGVIIRYIIEAEAINRNPKRDAVVVPTLPRTKGRAAIFFFGVYTFPEWVRQPPTTRRVDMKDSSEQNPQLPGQKGTR
jgi:hypothetical protein